MEEVKNMINVVPIKYFTDLYFFFNIFYILGSSPPRGGYDDFGGYGGGGGFGGSRNGGLGAGLDDRIRWDLSRLPKFEKNFYMEHPAVSKRSDADADKWRESVGIKILGRGVPKPVMTFEEASMPGKCFLVVPFFNF